MTRRTLDIDLNRVEGDLAIEVDIEDNVVVDARCIGTLYRGFEQIMLGRAAIDATVITPRVCGLCSTSHLYAATMALEHAWRIEVPPLATLMRDLGMMTEILQSDLRQSFLFFSVDFAAERYRKHPLYPQLAAEFTPFSGRLYRETLAITRKLLEIIALFGGQWPHSSWMVPGGLHPAAGRTVPNYPGAGDKYSWVKAPRYRGQVMQTGALAEQVIAGEPLLCELLAAEQGNTWLRQFARLRRAGRLIVELRAQAQRILTATDREFLNPVSPRHDADGDGYGLLQAARGALGHWVSIRDGKIAHYQIITPTTWNASPRDSLGRPGYWEASLIGTRLADPDDPIEIGHIIRSHDPCFVCSVHMTDTGRRLHFGAWG